MQLNPSIRTVIDNASRSGESSGGSLREPRDAANEGTGFAGTEMRCSRYGCIQQSYVEKKHIVYADYSAMMMECHTLIYVCRDGHKSQICRRCGERIYVIHEHLMGCVKTNCNSSVRPFNSYGIIFGTYVIDIDMKKVSPHGECWVDRNVLIPYSSISNRFPHILMFSIDYIELITKVSFLLNTTSEFIPRVNIDDYVFRHVMKEISMLTPACVFCGSYYDSFPTVEQTYKHLINSHPAITRGNVISGNYLDAIASPLYIQPN